MNIKLDLLKSYISDFINNNIGEFEIDAQEIADTTAISILREIQMILANNDYSDFEIVENIVCVFERYGVDAGNCHNF